MISHVAGTLEHKDKDFVTIEVAGVGYKIYAPSSTLDSLPPPGGKVKLFTEQVVREDSVSLYGFALREERNLFTTLLTVNGVGPKGAMALISGIPLDKLVAAITQGNVDLLVTAPGIGQKTAQRIIIELKEKLAKTYGLKPAQLTMGIPGGDTTLISDAMSGLMTLGLTPREAREAITGLKDKLDNLKSVEEIIKASLKNLY